MIDPAAGEHGSPEGVPLTAAAPTAFESHDDRLPMSAGSSARFRKLVQDHHDFIWRSLRGLGVPSDAADDAAQHVFWVASQKLDVIEPGKERSFLFGTAMGVAANARRGRNRSREISDADVIETRMDEAPNPEEVTQMKQARKLLDAALESMPDDLRTVFVPFELEGLATPEIAAMLAIPLGTAASRLRRAREEF